MTKGSSTMNTALDTTMVPLDGSAETGAGTSPLSENEGGLSGLDVGAPEPVRRVSQHTLLVAGVLVVAAGVLYGMRQLGLGPRTSSAKSTETLEGHEDTAISKIDHRAVLADLNTSRTKQQVPDDQVKKNPFRLAGVVTGMPVVPMNDNKAAAASAAEAEKQRKLHAEELKKIADMANQLKLNSAVGGSMAIARINGLIYRVGDRVQDVFTVKAIHGRSVDLEEPDGTLIQISMPDGDSK